MNDPKEKETGTAPTSNDLEPRQQDSVPVAPEIVKMQSEIGDPMRVISEGTKAERLARLREAREVVEDDSDMNDIFMFVRSNNPLTKALFLKSFPKAKALVITQEQLWSIEAGVDRDETSKNNKFSYISSSGEKKWVVADYMDEGLGLFLEDLGD